jgi:hypothetical protein
MFVNERRQAPRCSFERKMNSLTVRAAKPRGSQAGPRIPVIRELIPIKTPFHLKLNMDSEA